jgi:hypothetical protein
MSWFGSAMNFDCGIWESLLKFVAKRPAKTAQKVNAKAFLQQVNDRLVNSALLRKAQRFMSHESFVHSLKNLYPEENEAASDHEDQADGTPGIHSCFNKNPLYEVNFANSWKVSQNGIITRDKPLFLPCGKYHSPEAIQVHPVVIKWFRTQSLNRDSDLFDISDPIKCFTEYYRDENKFRAHPRHNGSSWYDWVMVKFQSSDEEIDVEKSTSKTRHKVKHDESYLYFGDEYYPCKILCFFVHPRTSEKKALVHCAERIIEGRCSILCEKWQMEYIPLPDRRLQDQDGRRSLAAPAIHCIDVDSFGDPVFVIEEVPGIKETITLESTPRRHSDEIILVRPMSWWATQFI